ncbi:MAG TPA: hypothetical protein VMV07_21945 [Streptosporangiaceae bacterium]|nr:hypothetical protein [Streptosporangiaceae bacterium]
MQNTAHDIGLYRIDARENMIWVTETRAAIARAMELTIAGGLGV